MLPWLKCGRPMRVAVLGDLILDEYLNGVVNRISPEAPVPVHLVKDVTHAAGGAANAARNIQLVGGQAYLFSFLGMDASSDILRGILLEDGVDVSGVLALEGRPTIKKTRISAGNQQLIRVDWEEVRSLSLSEEKVLMGRLQALDFDVLLISDYGKGLLSKDLLSKLFAFAKSRGIPTVVDPKGRDFSRYVGCDVITPNYREACEALGWESAETEALCRGLQDQVGLANIVLTLGPRGMAFQAKGGGNPPLLKKARAREVFDVSGAGDTVVAVLALCLVSDISWEEALNCASAAAGVVVEKWGTQPIYQHELEASLELGELPSQHKVVTKSNADKTYEMLRRSNKKIIFTNGCFDLLHAGHLSYLEKAKQLGDVLIIGVNDDDSVRRLKGESRPLIPARQRMQLLGGLACVDFVVPFGEDTPLELIKQISPHVLVKGADYQESEIVGAKFVRESGGSVERIDLVPDLSTTKIVSRIEGGGAPGIQ